MAYPPCVSIGTPGGRGPSRGAGPPPTKICKYGATYVLDLRTSLPYPVRMSHKNITLSIDEKVLVEFDAWRRRNAALPRGEAIRQLLEIADNSGLVHAGYVGPEKVDPTPPLLAIKQAVGRAVLTQTEKYVGVGHARVEGGGVTKDPPDEAALEEFYADKGYVHTQTPNLKKRDPMSQVEEYDDVPDAAPEDFDQTRRRR